MYLLPQLVTLRPAVTLPLTAVDRAVPFWPLSGLVYFSMFPLLLASFLAIRTRARAMRFLAASIVAQAIAMLCFLCWPVRYPRELFPLPEGTGTLGAALVHFCRAFDAPVNCLPSLHVSTIALCLAALHGSRWFRPALVPAALLAASTLTFKQHYLVDVPAGAALGLMAWRLCRRVETGSRPPGGDNHLGRPVAHAR